MAMTNCRECGASVSTKAGACPQCGAKVRRTSIGTWFVTGLFGVAAIAGVGSAMKRQDADERARAVAAAHEASKTPEQQLAEKKAKEAREAEFQRVVQVAKGVKAAMKNPASFELVDAIYMKDGTVCVTYRGTNSFNAVVTQTTGIDTKNKQVSWNAKCGGKTGTNYNHARAAL